MTVLRTTPKGSFTLAVCSLLFPALMTAPTVAADFLPLPALARVMVPPSPKQLADFELTDQRGRGFRFSSLRGQPALVFFGFAHCPDICPTTLQKLKLLTQTPGGAHGVPVVMISVDGDRDTPESMRAYLERFSGDFIGVTGDPEKVRGIAAQFSVAFFKGQPRDSSGRYDVEHTRQVYAVDKSGRLRAEFYDATLEAMQEVVQILMKE